MSYDKYLQTYHSLPLKKIAEDFSLKVIYAGDYYGEINIAVPDVTRPGLQLVGKFKHFGPDRIQILGNMEYSYLCDLSETMQRFRLSRLMATGTPCLILSRHNEPLPSILECAHKYKVPVLQTQETTSSFMSSLVKYLHLNLAPRQAIHAVLVEVFGEGLLIMGESGVGKSETALELVKLGHRLIADDLVEIRRVSDTTLVGKAPEVLANLLEIRGIGIVNIKDIYGYSAVRANCGIDFVVHLEFWRQDKTYARVGDDEETTEILGIKVPSITIPVSPGRNIARIAEVAAVNHRLKSAGADAAKALTDKAFAAKMQ